MDKKYIFVTGGVVSSLGKGIAASSIAALLKARGVKVTMQKIDPYINVDPGTMNPFQHGEVFVTEDGAETDLDVGHYERFLCRGLNRENNITTGKVYGEVIRKERKGDYLGKTVQVIPHITDEIKKRIRLSAKGKNTEAAIIEIGGTVGDIEGLPYIEAARQMKKDAGPENVMYIHLTLVPFIKAAGEIKTKPTQRSVSTLLSFGIQPDILLCRTEQKLSRAEKEKISLFCNVDINSVIQAIDVSTIYEVPVMLHKQGIDNIIARGLGLRAGKINLRKWNNIVRKIKYPVKRVTIAVVGKYTDVQDAYKSINEALCHAGAANNAGIDIKWVDSERLEKKKNAGSLLKGADGILVPGGFGIRGIEGKIKAAGYAREKKIPFLGICLGMQSAVIEYARNALKMKGAGSTEFNQGTKYPVICLLNEQKAVRDMGASMRLGSYPCRIKKNTLAAGIYNEKVIFERHRHRYEFNNQYREDYEKKGFKVCGSSPDGLLVEMMEISEHPYFIAVQFHPEFKSRPFESHPLFKNFVKAALKQNPKHTANQRRR